MCVFLSRTLSGAYIREHRDDYCDTEPIHLIWDGLERRHGVASLSTVTEAVRSLVESVQGDFDSVEEHYASLNQIAVISTRNSRAIRGAR